LEIKLQTVGLDLYYGAFHALKKVDFSIRPRTINRTNSQDFP